MATSSADNDDNALPLHYRRVHGAIWLIGLAILAWRGWWWPGILVLVAISGLIEAGLRVYAGRAAHTEAVQEVRVRNLPKNCPNCGGPLSPSTVNWANEVTALCPYCGTSIKVLDAVTPGPAKP